MKKLRKGLLITFEGGEGCGKSTHSMLLASYLKKKKYNVVKTLEPGATKVGKMIRKILLNGKEKLDALSEILLFAVDRVEHVKNVIEPELEKKKIIVCDRYIDSTTAYQMGGRKLSKNLVSFLNKKASFGIVPDVTIYLDVSYNEAMKRVDRRSKRDKFEKEKKAFHENVRKMYIKIAKNESGRVRSINTSGKISDVQNKIRKIADRLIAKYEK